MASKVPEFVRKQLAAETRDLFVQRVRLALLALVPFLGVFAVANFVLDRAAIVPLWILKLGQFGGIFVTIRLLGSDWGRCWAVPLVITELTYIYTNVAVGALVIHDMLITPTCVMGMSLVAAAAFPWGVLPQFLTAMVGVVAVVGNAVMVGGSPAAAFAYPQIAGVIGLTMSVYLTHVFGRHREVLLQGEVSAAVARLGQAMISSLDRPVLLARLCEVTTEVLGCDCSYTLLWNSKEETYLPVAGFGDTPERWEAMRVIGVPRQDLARQIERIELDDVVGVRGSDPGAAALRTRYGITAALCMALRRGSSIAGVHIAGYRGRTGPFSPQEERIGRSIAQLASMAMENARLVEELEEANRLKSDFVATMSHELRTPLNVIIGYNELLHSGAFGPLRVDQEKSIRRVEENARILLDLINATLDISRLEREELPLELQAVHVPALVAEVVTDMRDWREKPKLEFTWTVAEDVPSLQTDAVKLKVILKNLISNAIKFTARGTVALTVREAENGVEFAVSDTGIGIAPEAQAVIFEPFRKADSQVSVHYEGAGLGLYVTRRLVEALGGTIGVESEPGRGSTFRVWLPLHIGKVPRVRVPSQITEEKPGERVVRH